MERQAGSEQARAHGGGRRHPPRVVLRAARAAAALALGLACLTPAGVLAAGRTFPLFPYWADGVALTWYNFGSRSPVQDGQVKTQPMWIIGHGVDAKGAPVPLKGQGPIVDVLPEEPGYSDLWQLILVEAPPGYSPDSIRSRTEIEQSGLPQRSTGVLVNRPLVSRDDRLGGTHMPALHGWAHGQDMWYFDLGPASDKVAKEWRFVSGFARNGQPVFVDGQYTISDTSPTPFRELFYVEVPPYYVANSIKTVAGVEQSGYPILPAHIVVNVPLPVPSEVADEEARTPASFAIIGVFCAAWLACAVYLLRQPRPRTEPAAHPPAA